MGNVPQPTYRPTIEARTGRRSVHRGNKFLSNIAVIRHRRLAATRQAFRASSSGDSQAIA